MNPPLTKQTTSETNCRRTRLRAKPTADEPTKTLTQQRITLTENILNGEWSQRMADQTGAAQKRAKPERTRKGRDGKIRPLKSAQSIIDCLTAYTFYEAKGLKIY